MSREIEFVCTDGPYGDATCKYELKGVKGMMLQEFLPYIFKSRPNERGVFRLLGMEIPYDTPNHTLNGALDRDGSLIIKRVTALGGYGLMDYDIEFYEESCEAEDIRADLNKDTMSRETTFKEGAAVCGYEYSTSARLKEDIAKKEADVNYYKQRLLAMCCATPKDITPKDDEPLRFVTYEFAEIWDELQDTMFSLSDLYTIQLNEDCIDNAG